MHASVIPLILQTFGKIAMATKLDCKPKAIWTLKFTHNLRNVRTECYYTAVKLCISGSLYKDGSAHQRSRSSNRKFVEPLFICKSEAPLVSQRLFAFPMCTDIKQLRCENKLRSTQFVKRPLLQDDDFWHVRSIFLTGSSRGGSCVILILYRQTL